MIDLLTPLRDPQDCATCDRAKGVLRCPGAWFPQEPAWKELYCVFSGAKKPAEQERAVSVPTK